MYARDYRRIARDNLAGNWGVSVLVALVAATLGGLITGGSFSINIDPNFLGEYLTEEGRAILLPVLVLLSSVGSTLSFAQLVLGGVVSIGLCTYLLQQYDRSAPLEFKTLFSRFDIFLNAFVLRLLTNLFVVLWGMLLVIPGIVKSYSYAMAPFLMAENPHMTANQAITASRQMMRGHKWQLFCLDLSFIGWSILCAFTLGIGYLFLNPYKCAARAAFYRQLTGPSNTVESL